MHRLRLLELQRVKASRMISVMLLDVFDVSFSSVLFSWSLILKEITFSTRALGFLGSDLRGSFRCCFLALFMAFNLLFMRYFRLLDLRILSTSSCTCFESSDPLLHWRVSREKLQQAATGGSHDKGEDHTGRSAMALPIVTMRMVRRESGWVVLSLFTKIPPTI